MIPAPDLARLRKHVSDRVALGALTMAATAVQLGISRSRRCALCHRRGRYGAVGEPPRV